MPAHRISLHRICIQWFCADAISDVLLESGVQGEAWHKQAAAEGSVSGPQSRVLTQNLSLWVGKEMAEEHGIQKTQGSVWLLLLNGNIRY